MIATLLEPKVSLYQSYLGKAYYQLKRFPEGLAALASAKRLDSHDPTPWLYTSLFLRDQNRQLPALDELRHAHLGAEVHDLQLPVVLQTLLPGEAAVTPSGACAGSRSTASTTS